MTRDFVLTLVTVEECDDCVMVDGLVAELVDQNAALAMDFRIVDVDTDPRAVRAIAALSHPTLVLAVDGRERARLTGTISKRRLLRKLLPVLYPDDVAALAELRRQLESPAETFPRGPLRGRVRQAEKVKALRTVPLFGGLSRRQLGQLARLMDEIHRDEGQRLTREGEKGDEFFVVMDGAVTIERGGRRVAGLGPGECFGEMSLLDNQPRSATVTTSSATTLLVIHRDDFDRMLSSHPPIMRTLLVTLSERLR